MKEIEVHVHTKDGQKPQVIKIDEEATVEDLLRKVSSSGHAELYLVVGDEKERRERHHKLCDCGVKHEHHVHCHPHGNEPGHHEHLVKVVINGDPYETKAGRNSVEHLKKIGKVPADDILALFNKDGQFVDLDNNAQVEICGGEIFASHVKSAGSS